jgi:Yip1 domain.
MENEKIYSEQMTLGERISSLYKQPGKLMENLQRYPTILFPVFLLLLARPIYYLICYPGYLNFVKEMFNITNDELLNQQAVKGMFFDVGMLLVVWIVNTIVMYLYSKFMKGSGTFKQFLSTNGYAYLAVIPMLLIMIVGYFNNGNLTMNFSPSIFIKESKGTVIYGILRGFCIFAIYQNIMMGIGFYKVSKLSKIKSAAIIIVIFLSWVAFNFPYLRNMG